MFSVKQLCTDACSRPLEIITGLCVFSVAMAGGAVDSVASGSLAILFIACLFYAPGWSQSWRQLTRDEHLVLVCLGLYALSAVVAYYNVNDDYEYVKHLGRYIRFLLIIPVYLLLSRTDLKLFKYLLAGAIVSGPLYLAIALVNVVKLPEFPAHGDYHHITFGDMAMLNAMFMTSSLVFMKTGRLLKTTLVISIVCMLYVSVLSQARGAWLALPFCMSVLLYVSVQHKMIKPQSVLIALIVMVVVIVATPAKDVLSNRVQEAMHEIEAFQSGEDFATSVGGRFAMWHIAINVWKEHPVIGTGPGDFDEEIQASQTQGLYETIDVHSSVHNIFLQALATTGAIGFVVLCFALVVLPFRFFYRASKENMNIAGLGGMVMITAFAVFGLTESWILRSPTVAVYLLYFVILATTASKKIVESR